MKGRLMRNEYVKKIKVIKKRVKESKIMKKKK
jgi:hypothetical protein